MQTRSANLTLKRKRSFVDSRESRLALWEWLTGHANVHQQRQIIAEGQLDTEGQFLTCVDRLLNAFSFRDWCRWVVHQHGMAKRKMKQQGVHDNTVSPTAPVRRFPRHAHVAQAVFALDVDFFELVLRVKSHSGTIARDLRASVRNAHDTQVEHYRILTDRIRFLLSSNRPVRLAVHVLEVSTTHTRSWHRLHKLKIGKFQPATAIPDQYVWCKCASGGALAMADVRDASWDSQNGIVVDSSFPSFLHVHLSEPLVYPRAEFSFYAQPFDTTRPVTVQAIDHPPVSCIGRDFVMVSRKKIGQSLQTAAPVLLPHAGGVVTDTSRTVQFHSNTASSSSNTGSNSAPDVSIWNIPVHSRLVLTSRQSRDPGRRLDTFCTSLVDMCTLQFDGSHEDLTIEYRPTIVRLLWQETEHYYALVALADVATRTCGLLAPLWHLVCEYAFPSPNDLSARYRFPNARCVTHPIEHLLPSPL